MSDNTKMAERYARFTELRDAGMAAMDAAREIGVSPYTGIRYDRAYRAARHLPTYAQEQRAHNGRWRLS